MSSYVYEDQSRGVGAVAAHDLGAISRASGSPVRSIHQLRSARKAPAQVLARRKRGKPAKWFTAGRVGRLLSQPRKVVQVTATVPARGGAVVADTRTTDISESVITSRPGANTKPAALFEGEPPATEDETSVTTGAKYSAAWTPSGATLKRASRQYNAAIDAAAEAARGEAELAVPQITPAKKTRKLLIIGGLGVGALALIYILTRK